MSSERQRIYSLVKLNLALQVFDAVATYQGLKLGWQEANPILLVAFHYLGVGPALLLFKANACGLLFLLQRHADHDLVVPALHLLAAVYSILSLGPWLAKYAILLSRAL